MDEIYASCSLVIEQYMYNQSVCEWHSYNSLLMKPQSNTFLISSVSSS